MADDVNPIAQAAQIYLAMRRATASEGDQFMRMQSMMQQQRRWEQEMEMRRKQSNIQMQLSREQSQRDMARLALDRRKLEMAEAAHAEELATKRLERSKQAAAMAGSQAYAALDAAAGAAGEEIEFGQAQMEGMLPPLATPLKNIKNTAAKRAASAYNRVQALQQAVLAETDPVRAEAAKEALDKEVAFLRKVSGIPGTKKFGRGSTLKILGEAVYEKGKQRLSEIGPMMAEMYKGSAGKRAAAAAQLAAEASGLAALPARLRDIQQALKPTAEAAGTTVAEGLEAYYGPMYRTVGGPALVEETRPARNYLRALIGLQPERPFGTPQSEELMRSPWALGAPAK